MANLDFYAAHDDMVNLLDFLWSETDVRVFESYSPYGVELTEFSSIEDLEARYPLGVDIHGNGSAILLQLWSPTVMADVQIERINLNPESCNGHTFRYCIRGGGLIQLYLGGVHEKEIIRSHYGHNSQKLAQAWNAEQGVYWERLAKLSNKIQYHIRQRLAAAKVLRHPILPQALELVRQGYRLHEYPGSPWQYITEKLHRRRPHNQRAGTEALADETNRTSQKITRQDQARHGL